MIENSGLQRRYVPIPGGSAVHCRLVGDGPPVVLIPDTPGSGCALADLALDIAGLGFRVAVPDLAGAGGTTAPWQGGLSDQSLMIKGLIEGLDWERPVIIGDGVGAAVAAQFVTTYPGCSSGPVRVVTPPYCGSETAPQIDWSPDLHGLHLLRLWNLVRDHQIHLPWWKRVASARRDTAMPAPLVLHGMFVDALENPSSHEALQEEVRRCWDVLVGALDLPPVILGAVRQGPGLRGALQLEDSTASDGAAGSVPTVAAADPGVITRDYVDVRFGQMHVRYSGSIDSGKVPLVLLHANPGSGRGVEDLVSLLGADRFAVAIDLPGHGRSDPLPEEEWESVTLGAYAPIVAEVMTKLGVNQFDVYGSHTGAGLAAEVAIDQPDRVRRVVFDGMPLFDDQPELVESVQQNYFIDLTPDIHGSHILRAWGMHTDLYLWWPWFRQLPESARTTDAQSAAHVHGAVVDMLRSLPTYAVAYRAVWGWPATMRLPLVTQRCVVGTTTRDSLRLMTPKSLALLPRASDTDFSVEREPRAREVAAWLDQAE